MKVIAKAVVAKANEVSPSKLFFTAESLREIAEINPKYTFIEETGELVTKMEETTEIFGYPVEEIDAKMPFDLTLDDFSRYLSLSMRRRTPRRAEWLRHRVSSAFSKIKTWAKLGSS